MKENMNQYPQIFKKAKNKKTCVWYMEQEGDKYRTISGYEDGEKVISKWTTAEPKNVGRSNATTGEEQAIAEIEAEYTKKLAQGGYTESIKDIGVTSFIKPMLAHKLKDHPIEDWTKGIYSQPKLDGIRAIYSKGKLWSRQGKPIVSCPHIIDELKSYVNQALILDGELYNHDLKDNFNKIVSLVRKVKPSIEELKESEKIVQYHIYDIVDTTMLFSDRSDEIITYVPSDSKYLKIVETHFCTSEEKLQTRYSEYMADGYEGQIVRHNALYENCRSKSLLKNKEFEDKEFKVVDIEEGVGNRSGMAGTIIYKLDAKRTFRSSIRGGEEFYTKLLKNKKKFIGGEGTVRFFHLTPDGVPRFPVTVALYEKGRTT